MKNRKGENRITGSVTDQGKTTKINLISKSPLARVLTVEDLPEIKQQNIGSK